MEKLSRVMGNGDCRLGRTLSFLGRHSQRWFVDGCIFAQFEKHGFHIPNTGATLAVPARLRRKVVIRSARFYVLNDNGIVNVRFGSKADVSGRKSAFPLRQIMGSMNSQHRHFRQLTRSRTRTLAASPS
jgi:hypothetical protein